ncbi:polysaccharide deacetylase family protein [Ectobacillus sp. sgz5001026]|uniref:polysaccharide deacetylase family protein n=1 Tax=Ectobacillus sp. sgz5001026 TaxID=3242473 RepID=UPI0036D27148
MKYALVLLLTLLSLTGCSFTSQQSKHATSEVPTQTPVVKKATTPSAQGLITWDAITYKSTQTTLYMKNLQDTFTEVQYMIWRIADGPSSARHFSSKDTSNHFSLPFSLQIFDYKRGEYQIQTVGVKADGSNTPLAYSTITFEQKIPMLMYHGIDDYRGVGFKSLFVPPAQFESHVQYLKDNGYTLLTFERWSERNRVNKPIFLTFDDGMKDNLNAYNVLKKLKDASFQPAATFYVISALIDKDGYLSANDIKSMSDSGIISFGSHSDTHDFLTKVPNLEQELQDSSRKISDVTGKAVVSLSYPTGVYNDKVVGIAKNYYDFAVTSDDGQFIQKGLPNERYLIERIYITPTMSMNRFINVIQE